MHPPEAVKNMFLNQSASHWELNAEHSGKADNWTYKQNACQVVSKEVQSHFPWIIPSK